MRDLENTGNQQMTEHEEQEFPSDVMECKKIYLDLKEDLEVVRTQLKDINFSDSKMVSDPTWRYRANSAAVHMRNEMHRLTLWLQELGCTDFAGPRAEIGMIKAKYAKKVANVQKEVDKNNKQRGAVMKFIREKLGEDAFMEARAIIDAAGVEFNKKWDESQGEPQ